MDEEEGKWLGVWEAQTPVHVRMHAMRISIELEHLFFVYTRIVHNRDDFVTKSHGDVRWRAEGDSETGSARNRKDQAGR